MLSDLQLVYMGPRNSTQLLKINTTKFQVEREPVYIDSKILLWITNFLNNRKQRVVVDGSFSHFADVESGVPQGTVLGPLLFLLHINDLPSCVNSKVRLFVKKTRQSNNSLFIRKMINDS